MGVATRSTAAAADLLERNDQLVALRDELANASAGRGRLIVVAGEAGVGKTTLLRHFAAREDGNARVLWGACDALFTPRALGPLLDVARATRGELARLVLAGARPHEVYQALVAELERNAPTMLVLEDVHWADEATLDVLRLLGRRVSGTGALILASYRDDGLDRTHPLRVVLGELAMQPEVGRLRLQPLSSAAVALLAEPYGADPDEIFRTTAGNPFFVTEVLASGSDAGIPETVRDAVLARVAHLSPAARALVEAVAVVPPKAELWLLEELAGEGRLAPLDECLASGMLVAEPGGVAFRHELARLAVAESLPPVRSLDLHRSTLTALSARPVAGDELARLAHHAEAAQDGAAVLELAPAAAAHASARGAHREAAAHFARALRYGGALPPEERAGLLLQRAWACYLSDQAEEAVEAVDDAASCYRECGDTRREADALRVLAIMLWCPGRIEEAMRAALEAVARLERLPPGHELAMALATVSELHARDGRVDAARTWGHRAAGLARDLGDDEALGNALNSIGSVEMLKQGIGSAALLEQTLELAERIGHAELKARVLLNLADGSMRHRAYGLADAYIETGIEFCRGRERNVELLDLYFLRSKALLEFETGRWNDALETAIPLVLRDRCRSVLPRTVALVVLGLVRARRGDPDVWSPLDEALALVLPTGEPARIAMVAAARAEAAWLAGRRDRVLEETGSAVEHGVPSRSLTLTYWRWRAGAHEPATPRTSKPETLEMVGDWKNAAEVWTQLGCPYQAAVALLDADEESALRQALSELRWLGAGPAAAIAARRLRELGFSGIARGPRPATRGNPAHLTSREIEILRLVAEGLRNAEVAQRLFLSIKTVDHHVSSILRKLEARTRGEAADAARRLGLLEAR